MVLPRPVYDTCKRYAAKFPPPQIQSGEDTSDHEKRCREWTIKMDEQVCYEHGAAYGAKKASPTRPISKDSLAHKAGAQQNSWDMLRGAGSGHPTFANYPPPNHDIDAQVFVIVPAKNHLGATVPPEPEPGPQPPEPTPCPPYEPPVSYNVFVTKEAPEVAAKFESVHGSHPAPSDLYHNAWRRLVEGWTHEAILADIK